MLQNTSDTDLHLSCLCGSHCMYLSCGVIVSRHEVLTHILHLRTFFLAMTINVSYIMDPI